MDIPSGLFHAVARYLLEHAPADQKAEGLYNGMVLAFAEQSKPEAPSDDNASGAV